MLPGTGLSTEKRAATRNGAPLPMLADAVNACVLGAPFETTSVAVVGSIVSPSTGVSGGRVPSGSADASASLVAPGLPSEDPQAAARAPTPITHPRINANREATLGFDRYMIP